MRGTHRERQRHREREKQAPHREPNMGLDPSQGCEFEPYVGCRVDLKIKSQGHLGGSVVEHPPSVQVMIPGSWD